MASDIFNFNDPIDFIEKQLLVHKEKNQHFSVRVWARQLGFENSSYISSILKGQRKLQPDLAQKISANFKLSASQSKYFSLLVLLRNAKHEHEKILYTELLSKYRSAKSKQSFLLSLDSFRFIADWFHIAALEAMSLKSFNGSESSITQRLGHRLNVDLITKALQRLERLGLVSRNKHDRWVRHKERHLELAKELPDSAVKSHHLKYLEFAKNAVTEQSFNERDIRGTLIPLKMKDYDRAKEIIQKAHAEILSLSSDDGDELYHFSSQWFRLSEPMESK